MTAWTFCCSYLTHRVGQNHTHTVRVQYLWQGRHQIYGHIRCINTVLANLINPRGLSGWRSLVTDHRFRGSQERRVWCSRKHTYTCMVSQNSIHRVGQNRLYTPYMTVYLMISLPKIPYIHRIYKVLANPKYTYTCRSKSPSLQSIRLSPTTNEYLVISLPKKTYR
jgi:hypothetical protein